MTYIKDICPNSQILCEKLHKFDQKCTFQQYLCDFDLIFEGNTKSKAMKQHEHLDLKSVSIKLHVFTSKALLLVHKDLNQANIKPF